MVSARSIARATAKGYLSTVRWVMTETGVKRIHHGEMLAPEELRDDIPRVFPGDLVLTATINGQEHVLKYLLERGMNPLRTDFIDAVQPEVGARLKDGRLPFKDDHGLILCYEDAERGENVQVWGRKVDIPIDFAQRNIFQQDRPVGAHRGMHNHIAPA